MRKRYLLWFAPTLVLGVLWWWLHGGQAWLALHTGTDNCVNLPAQYVPVCRYYGFWSGFGSDLGEYVIIGGLLSQAVLLFRHINCHAPGCPRVGRYQLAGGEYKVCGHHNPDFSGHRPTLEHIHRRHREHREALCQPSESPGRAPADAAPAASSRSTA